MQYPRCPVKPFYALHPPQKYLTTKKVVASVPLFDEDDVDFSLIDTSKKWRFISRQNRDDIETYELEQYEDVTEENPKYEMEKKRHDDALAEYEEEMKKYNIEYEKYCKFTQQEIEAKERAEYERLKNKYGQKL